MNRRITLAGLLLIIINGTIGSAWLFAPFYAAKIAGSGALLAWILGGFMTILIAFTFAETSGQIPMVGGTTEVARYTHGELTAFIVSWIAWISNITIPAIEVQAVLQYAANYLPFLIVKSQSGADVLSFVGICCAVVLMFGLVFLNTHAIKTVLRSNIIILFFKVVVIFLTIFVIMTTVFHTSNFAATGDSHLGFWKSILTALATGGVAFAFVGFKHGVELSGETIHPKKSVPLAIVGSVVICLLLYLGLQIVFIGAISPVDIATGWQHLSFTGDLGPFAGIAGGLGLFWLVKLLMADAVVSPLGAGSVYVSSTARLTYAMSSNGYFPRLFSKLNVGDVPVAAILFNTIVGCLLFLPLPNWQTMVQFLTSIMVISYAMGPVALMSLRQIKKEGNSGFKLPFAKLLAPLAFYFCNLISYWTGWDTVSKTIIVLFIGVVILLFAKRKDYSSTITSIKSALWLVPYFIGLTLISYLGAFGGKNIIPFGWDFTVLAAFSFIIFHFAVKGSEYCDEKSRSIFTVAIEV